MGDEEVSFILETAEYDYHSHLRIMRNGGRLLSAGLRIGGMTRGCLSLTYFPVNDHTLHINKIDYNERCATKGNLPRGTGTRHMLLTALSYMLAHDEFGSAIKHVTLDDASKVPCRMGEGKMQDVSLMYLYIALHGKTWYQEKFGAFVHNVTLRETYAANLERLTDSDFKGGVPIEAMRDRMLLASVDHATVDAILALYASAACTNLRTFFKQINERFKDTFCVVTNRWLDQFIDDVVLEGIVDGMTKWEISSQPPVGFTVREVDNPPEDVFPIKGGAKARVRRYHMSFGETSVRYG